MPRSELAHCAARTKGFCCGPVSLPMGGRQECILTNGLPARRHHEGSQRDIFPVISLVRGTVLKNVSEYESNKKLIPKRQGLKAIVSSLKSGGERNESLPPVFTKMGKSVF